MTAPKGTYRKRRKTTLSNIPRGIKEWFSGERRFTFYAYTHPYCEHLEEYWKTYLEEHPKAKPPEKLDLCIRAGKKPKHEDT